MMFPSDNRRDMNQPTFVNLKSPHESSNPVDDAIREKMLAIAGATIDTPMTVQAVQIEREEDILQITTFIIPEEDTGLAHLFTHGVGSLPSQTNVNAVMDGNPVTANYRAEYHLVAKQGEEREAQILLAQLAGFLQVQQVAFPPGTVVGGLSVEGTDVGGFLFTDALTDGEPTHPVIVSNPEMFIFHLRLVPLRQAEIDLFNQEQNGPVNVAATLAAHAEKENAWSLNGRPDIEWVRQATA